MRSNHQPQKTSFRGYLFLTFLFFKKGQKRGVLLTIKTDLLHILAFKKRFYRQPIWDLEKIRSYKQPKVRSDNQPNLFITAFIDWLEFKSAKKEFLNSDLSRSFSSWYMIFRCLAASSLNWVISCSKLTFCCSWSLTRLSCFWVCSPAFLKFLFKRSRSRTSFSISFRSCSAWSCACSRSESSFVALQGLKYQWKILIFS